MALLQIHKYFLYSYKSLYNCLNYGEEHSKYYQCVHDSLIKCHPELANVAAPTYTPLITDPDYAWFDDHLRRESCNCIYLKSQKTYLDQFNSFLASKPNLKKIQLESHDYRSSNRIKIIEYN